MMRTKRLGKAPLLPMMAVAGLLAAAVPGVAAAGDGIVWHEQQRGGYAVEPERVSVEEYTEYRTVVPQGPTAGRPVRVEASAPPPLPYKPYPETELWRNGGYVVEKSATHTSSVRKAGHKKHAVKQSSKNCNCAKVSSKAHGAKAATRTATSAPAGSHKQKLAGVAQHQRLKAVKTAQNSQARVQHSQRMASSAAGAVPVTVVTPDSRVPALVRPAAQAATIVRNNAGDPGAPGWESRTRTVTTVQNAPVAWQEQRAVSYVDYGAQPAVWGGPIYPGRGR